MGLKRYKTLLNEGYHVLFEKCFMGCRALDAGFLAYEKG